MGTLFRIAILLIAVGVVLMLLKRAWHKRRPPATPPAQADMLRCDHCGVFVPRSEAIAARGRHYCTSAHLDADRLR